MAEIKLLSTKADLEEAIKGAGQKLLMIDCFATWCGPCKQIAPKVQEWAGKYPDVVFAKLDVDENDEGAQELKVEAMPSFIFFKGGEKVDTFVGANPNAIEDKIKSLK